MICWRGSAARIYSMSNELGIDGTGQMRYAWELSPFELQLAMARRGADELALSVAEARVAMLEFKEAMRSSRDPHNVMLPRQTGRLRRL